MQFSFVSHEVPLIKNVFWKCNKQCFTLYCCLSGASLLRVSEFSREALGSLQKWKRSTQRRAMALSVGPTFLDLPTTWFLELREDTLSMSTGHLLCAGEPPAHPRQPTLWRSRKYGLVAKEGDFSWKSWSPTQHRWLQVKSMYNSGPRRKHGSESRPNSSPCETPDAESQGHSGVTVGQGGRPALTIATSNHAALYPTKVSWKLQAIRSRETTIWHQQLTRALHYLMEEKSSSSWLLEAFKT